MEPLDVWDWVREGAAALMDETAGDISPAAAAVVHDFLGQQAPGLAGRLTRWLRRHVEAATRRPRRHWQWDLTLTAWVLEQAGAPRRVASEGQEFEDVIAAIGIDAQARRQGPFFPVAAR